MLGWLVTRYFGIGLGIPGAVSFTDTPQSGGPLREALGAWHLWIPASVVTWLILVRRLSRASLGEALSLGLLSVPLGAALFGTASVLQKLAAGALEFSPLGLLAAPIGFATLGLMFTWPVTVPTCLATALLLRFALNRWENKRADRRPPAT